MVKFILKVGKMMDYRARTNKLQKQLTDPRLRVRTFGIDKSKHIVARIDEIAAATTLTDISRFPPARLHALTGDKEGLFSVDISANYRLLFAGFDHLHQQNLSPAEIVAVVFIAVVDYH